MAAVPVVPVLGESERAVSIVIPLFRAVNDHWIDPMVVSNTLVMIRVSMLYKIARIVRVSPMPMWRMLWRKRLVRADAAPEKVARPNHAVTLNRAVADITANSAFRSLL